MKEVSFRAPWGAPLVIMTVFCLALSLVVGVGGFCWAHVQHVVKIPIAIGWTFVGISLFTVVTTAAFMVRGYRLRNGTLRIQRLGWETCFDLSRLTSATVDPDAFKRSLRLFGNGGFFVFAGWFRNSKLGVYRAFATDAKRAVVLRFSDKTIVITPDDPQKFVADIQAPHGT